MTDSSSGMGAGRPNFYVPEIDGLRTIAVCAVMLFHLRASFMLGGFAGVDVFFVISGYVVSASLARSAGCSFVSFMQEFYVRRMLRILPVLLVCLLVTTAAPILFVPASWLSEITQNTGLCAFFGVSNFALLSADSYFSPRPDYNPFIHTWSLAVEEQFYLLFPPLVFVWLRLGNYRGLLAVAANALLPLLSFCSFVALWGNSAFPPRIPGASPLLKPPPRTFFAGPRPAIWSFSRPFGCIGSTIL